MALASSNPRNSTEQNSVQLRRQSQIKDSRWAKDKQYHPSEFATRCIELCQPLEGERTAVFEIRVNVVGVLGSRTTEQRLMQASELHETGGVKQEMMELDEVEIDGCSALQPAN